MVREIVRDPVFLQQKSQTATEDDLPVAADLMDTLRANMDRCAGMAANMIGERKRIIAFCNGPVLMIMINPEIVSKSGEYTTEEACLSLAGKRNVKRYRTIAVTWQDMNMKTRSGILEGFAAQIVQHEIDHCNGILI